MTMKKTGNRIIIVVLIVLIMAGLLGIFGPDLIVTGQKQQQGDKQKLSHNLQYFSPQN